MAVKVTQGQLGIAVPFGELLGASDQQLHAELQDYVDLGVDWIRMDFHWDLIQPSSGTWNWNLVDKVVDATAEYGINIVGLLEDRPDWVNSDLSDYSAKQSLATFAGRAAERYADTIDHWEVQNEPNMKGIDPDDYAEALALSYDAIKAADSGDTVISAGLAAVPDTGDRYWGAVDYLDAMYRNGAGDHLDAVGYHPYTWPLQPSDSAAWNGWQIMEDGIRDTMVSNGDGDKQVWMTELGGPTDGSGSAVSNSELSQMIREAVDLSSQTTWAGPIMWYTYQDRGGSTGSTENWYGLLNPDGSRKEAYYTYRDLANKDNGGSSSSVAPPPSGSESDGVHVLTKASNTYLGDFSSGDVIDLSAIDADTTLAGNQSFNFIGGNWLDEAGDLGVYRNASHDKTYVAGDLNGDSSADFTITLPGLHDLGAGDLGIGGSHSLSSGDRTVRIDDFSAGEVIDLSAIDADTGRSGNQSFDFIGGDWLSEARDVGVYQGSGTTYIQGRTDGGSGFDINVIVAGNHRIDADNLIL